MDPWLGRNRRRRESNSYGRWFGQRLVEQYGFKGAESAMRQFVARVCHPAPEPYLPLMAAWSETAQVDLGEQPYASQTGNCQTLPTPLRLPSQ